MFKSIYILVPSGVLVSGYLKWIFTICIMDILFYVLIIERKRLKIEEINRSSPHTTAAACVRS